MKIGIYTLGCKVNQYETQAMEQELTARGHELVDFESPADAYIINTCSVTAVSDKKSRQMIRRAKKNSPDAVVAACGCYVQTHEKEAKSLGIDLSTSIMFGDKPGDMTAGRAAGCVERIQLGTDGLEPPVPSADATGAFRSLADAVASPWFAQLKQRSLP